MQNELTRRYDFDEVRPVLVIAGLLAILMFIAGWLVGVRGFLWFVLAGGIISLIGSYYLEKIVVLLTGGSQTSPR